MEKSGERFYESDVHRVNGELRLMQGAGDAEVEEHHSRAIRVAQSQNGKILELRATVSLCRLWRSQGKTAEARERLEPILVGLRRGLLPGI